MHLRVALSGLALFVAGYGHGMEPVSCSEPFEQQVHQAYTTEQGLPDNDTHRIACDATGEIVVLTAKGTAVRDGEAWAACAMEFPPAPRLEVGAMQRLREKAGHNCEARAVTEHGGEFAVAADTGLYTGDGTEWRMELPRQAGVRWAPVDVRAVAYDFDGRLWFASPQGVGCRIAPDDWRLFTGAEGLPFNDFTCMAAGPKGVWCGTSNGAIQFRDGKWAFRQGRRWLLDNHVRDIAVDSDGNAWFATSKGVSGIVGTPMTLARKAQYFEDEIGKHHLRTQLGYVDPAKLSAPGVKTNAAPVYTDNDGHFTGLYLAAASLGYAATGRDSLRQDAARAFRALAFLSEVTQGGTHPAPKGFIARTVLPTSEPDPNPEYGPDYDDRRNAADSLWKRIQPRWPLDATGKWYWKNDSSSDELDGHFLGYATYYDNVCGSDAEKNAVREVVRRVMDHVLDHGYAMVDHDGKPTRWGHFSPDDMNRNEAWHDERGLNSLSILTYLSIAHHVTGDPIYRDHFLSLALEHGYAMNGMTQPKSISGPGMVGHQPDDNMAFMNYYSLLRYETDPKLLGMFQHAVHSHWQHEKRERNPFANYVYAACCAGKTRPTQWGPVDLSPPKHCYSDAADTLARYPLDLVNWPMSNAHRIDMLPLLDEQGQPSGKGGRRDGQVFPIDERHETYWDLDPWALAGSGDGMRLREGTPYLLAYYMGRAHGFIRD